MPIEESYIGKNLSEHTDMANNGYLVRAGCSTCAPVYLIGNDWWGRGGMIDWTQPAAGAHWHNTQRDHLINEGVLGHWLDLGEPEMYDGADWTSGLLPGKHAHADQQRSGSVASVTIAASSGTYTGAPSSRPNVVEMVADTQASAVTLNGSPLTQHSTKAAFDAAASGWYNAGGNLIVAKSTSLPTSTAKSFQFTLGQSPVSMNFSCTNGTTVMGQSVYAVGNVPQLGEWSVASAVKLSPTSYPTWTGTIGNLPPNTSVEWKCIKRQEANYPDSADAWQPGPNSTFTTPAMGSGGTTTGAF